MAQTIDGKQVNLVQEVSSAVRHLATSPKAIRSRLEEAFCNHLQQIEPESVPGMLGISLKRIQEQFRNGRALSLKDPVAQQLAREIFDLYQNVLSEAQEQRDALSRNITDHRS